MEANALGTQTFSGPEMPVDNAGAQSPQSSWALGHCGCCSGALTGVAVEGGA